MPKPNGDNKLTKDLLRLRDRQIDPTEGGIVEFKELKAEPVISGKIELTGPDFELNVSVKGPPWIVRQMLQDLDESLGNIW